MSYECVVKRLASDEIAITARESQEPPVPAGSMLVEVECSVVDVQHLDRILASEGAGRRWNPLHWCSLVGRVAQVGRGLDQIQVGERVSAMGPVASRVLLPAQECLVVPDDVHTDPGVYWALLSALIRSIRRLRIEIGESVLVVGGGLVGSLVAQLSLVAGAGIVVGIDPQQQDNGRGFRAHKPGPAPTWVANQEALPRALSNGQVDVLIDVVGDLERLHRLLSLVRVGGRAMLLTADDADPVDFDFYPGVHRRSLILTGGTLRAALQRGSNGELGHTREAAFINYLFQHDRLSLAHQIAARVHPIHSAAQTLPALKGLGLIVQWSNYEETG